MIDNNENRWLKAAFIVSLFTLFFSFLTVPLALKLISMYSPSAPMEYKVLTGTIPHQLLMLCAVPLVCFFIKTEKSFAEIMGFANWKFSYFIYAFVIEIMLFPLMALLIFSFGILLAKTGIPAKAPPVMEIIKNCNWQSFAIIAFGAIIIAPLSEEIIFRRVFYGFLSKRMNPVSAAVLVSGLFAGIHQSILQFPALFILGLVLQFLYVRFNSLYPAIILHVLQNSISISLLLLLKISGIYLQG